MDAHRLLRTTEKLIVDNSPSILTGVGVAGTVLTAYLTGTASIKAVQLVKERNEEQDVHDLFMPKKELVKLVWTLYIPPVGVGALTIASIIGANRIGTRRAAALAAAYSVSERAFTEYRDKVVQKLGENKERGIRDEIAQDQVAQTPLSKEVFLMGSGSDVLCYEAHTGRYFMCSVERIRKAENEINHQLLHESYASLSDLFDKIGLSRTAYSEEVGWKNDTLLEIRFSAVLSEDDKPCISINYRVEPVRDYHRFN